MGVRFVSSPQRRTPRHGQRRSRPVHCLGYIVLVLTCSARWDRNRLVTLIPCQGSSAGFSNSRLLRRSRSLGPVDHVVLQKRNELLACRRELSPRLLDSLKVQPNDGIGQLTRRDRAARNLGTPVRRNDADAESGRHHPECCEEVKSRRAAFHEEVRTGKRADGKPLSPEQRRQDEDDLENYRTFTEETAALRRVFPTPIYGDSLTLLHGGRELRSVAVTGDQEGTTVLYLPKERILITGDAISFPIPYVSPHPAAQLRDLEMLSRLDVNVIVPGHGPAFYDKQFLELERRLLESVVRARPMLVAAALRVSSKCSARLRCRSSTTPSCMAIQTWTRGTSRG